MSAVVGNMQQKYLPFGAMARTQLTLELTLGDQEKVQADNFQQILKNIEYVAEIIQLVPTVVRALMGANGGGIVVPYSTYS
jgi:hypothetical protein